MRRVLGTLRLIPADFLANEVLEDTLNRHLPAFDFHERTDKDRDRGRERERERESERVRDVSFTLLSLFLLCIVVPCCAVTQCGHISHVLCLQTCHTCVHLQYMSCHCW